jgi:hypothetical protein
MPSRPRAHILEDLAKGYLHSTFASQGWTVEDLGKDYGEDFLVRIFEKGLATPWTFFVQSKATDDIARFKAKNGHHLALKVTSGHAKHWAEFSEPVVLTVYDAKTQETYWEIVQTHFEEADTPPKRKSLKSVTINVPLDNTLNNEGLRRLRNRTKHRFLGMITRKEGAGILIDQLRKHWGVEITYAADYGLLILPEGRFVAHPSKSAIVAPFGKCAATLEKWTKKIGVDADVFLETAIFSFYKKIIAIEAGKTIRIRDGKSIRKFKTINDLNRYLHRRSELDDD